MKTKMRLPVLVLAVAIAATAVAANLFGSATTSPLPVPGDPIPGVDVSIEQSPGGIMKDTTDDKGTATFAKVNPGQVVIRCAQLTPATNTKRPPGLIVVSDSGGARARGQWKDTSKPFKMEMVIEGREPRSVTVTVQLLDEPKRGVKPESDQDLSRVKAESDQVTPISGVVVTVKKLGATVATDTTNAQGIVTFALNPGKYDVTSSAPPSGRATANYNSSKSNTAGIAGATVDSGALTFTPTSPGMAKITVAGPGPGPKTITVTFKQAPTPQTTNPK